LKDLNKPGSSGKKRVLSPCPGPKDHEMRLSTEERMRRRDGSRRERVFETSTEKARVTRIEE